MIYNAYQDSDNGLYGISIVSGGHIFAQQGRAIQRNSGRPDYLLFYVAKGSEHMFLNDEIKLTEGGFVIFRPYEKQIHIQKSSKTSEFYYVHFNAPKDFDLFGFKSSFAYLNKPSAKVVDLFEEILDELQSKKPAYEQVCVSKLFNIMFLLKRKLEKSTHPLGQYTDKISFVIQKMNKEYEKNCSLEDYAKICCMSKYHFLRVFKHVTGCSPMEYRNSIRLEHAKDLLLDTKSSVDEIASAVGYTSAAYFCNAFKSKFGVSPGQYRKNSTHTLF